MGHAAPTSSAPTTWSAAWGGLRFLGDLGLDVDCVAGPATDNSAGVDYIEQRFGVAAANARTDPAQLAA